MNTKHTYQIGGRAAEDGHSIEGYLGVDERARKCGGEGGGGR